MWIIKDNLGNTLCKSTDAAKITIFKNLSKCKDVDRTWEYIAVFPSEAAALKKIDAIKQYVESYYTNYTRNVHYVFSIYQLVEVEWE